MSDSVNPAQDTGAATEERPHPARIYDFYLGGSDNLPVDRAAAEGFVKLMPGSPVGARANRRVLNRAVRYATRNGVRQFLDVGSGFPSAQATHEVAPDARVVYVDNDRVVAQYAHRILGDAKDGRTAFVTEDVRNPDAILAAPETKELLDLSQPVGVIFGALLHFVLDEEDPYALVERYKEVLAPGSMVLLTHSSPDYVSPEVRVIVDEIYTRLRVPSPSAPARGSSSSSPLPAGRWPSPAWSPPTSGRPTRSRRPTTIAPPHARTQQATPPSPRRADAARRTAPKGDS